MQKNITLLLLLITFISCKKGNQPTPEIKDDSKLYDVTIKVSDFSQTVEPFAMNGTKKTQAVGDTLGNYADNMYYRIFKSTDGTLVKSISQSKSDSNFGKFSDQLPAGTYDVFVAASKGELTFSYVASPNTFSNALFGPVPLTASSPETRWNDTFTKKFSLTVGNAPVSQDIRLDRVVSGIEITLTDAMPSEVARIVVGGYDAYKAYLKTGEIYGKGLAGYPFDVAVSDAGVKNKKFMFYCYMEQTIPLYIQAVGRHIDLLAEKVIYSVPMVRNKKTFVTGSLFSPVQTNFGITVDPTWTPSGPVKTF